MAVSDNSTLTHLTAEDLLAGAAVTYDVLIPPDVLRPGGEGSNGHDTLVRLRPLTLGTFLLIMKAAKDDAGLIPLLMIQESLLEPKLSLGQIGQMHLGLINFLIGQIRHISGLDEKKRS
ncbi:MAG: hypothetical protein EHM39_01680 [Chloroflexi bacterium]|nr:MAG: hypothetical protein EHM39_01680 [Chloroflexota bacterium]